MHTKVRSYAARQNRETLALEVYLEDLLINSANHPCVVFESAGCV